MAVKGYYLIFRGWLEITSEISFNLLGSQIIIRWTDDVASVRPHQCVFDPVLNAGRSRATKGANYSFVVYEIIFTIIISIRKRSKMEMTSVNRLLPISSITNSRLDWQWKNTRISALFHEWTEAVKALKANLSIEIAESRATNTPKELAKFSRESTHNLFDYEW